MSLSTDIDEATLALLEKTCTQCRQALKSESDEALRKTMAAICEACKPVRELIPELLELKRKGHALNLVHGKA